MSECCGYVEESNNETVYNEVIEFFPTRINFLPRACKKSHSIAYVLKGVKKQIEEFTISGDENVFPLLKAVADMPGSVSFVIL